MEPQSGSSYRVRKVRRWLPEATLVLVSVALGFIVAQFEEYRDERRLRAQMLAGLAEEVQYNLGVLEPMVPLHDTWTTSLADAEAANGQSGLDVWFATRPEFPEGARSPFPFLRRSAWDAALAGGALRLIDYDVAAALSEVYRMQEVVVGNIDRLATGALSSTSTYDPAEAEVAIKLLWLTLADIQSAEAALLDLYRQRLSLIRAAAEDAN